MQVRLDAPDARQTMTATAKVTGPDINGTATFTEYEVDDWKYVHIRLEVQGKPTALAAGKHAVHIHEKGDCECDGFTCAGGHFDPGPAGETDPDTNHGYHAGDLPNLTVDASGYGELETITSRVTLSDGPVSILQPAEGTSLMIHGNPDPYQPGEHGSKYSGGPRLACGRIEKT